MSKVILDASAFLALLNEEPGCDIIESVLPQVIMSAVNVSEVTAFLINKGWPLKNIQEMTYDLISEIVLFDEKQAFIAGEMRKSTKSIGLSLGDRACLALAKVNNHPIYTADRAWAKLNLKIAIQIIR